MILKLSIIAPKKQILFLDVSQIYHSFWRENKKAIPLFISEKSLLVAPPIQISNELLEDTRDMAKIWDMYGSCLKLVASEANLKHTNL